MNHTIIAGVGMTPFATPGKSDTYNVMAANAVRMALADAGIELSQVQQAYAGYVHGDSTSGQKALYEVGMTGLPVVNVNNNCSSGSSALWLAATAVKSGTVECALAFGFEQMKPGALSMLWTDDRPSPVDKFLETARQRYDAPADLPMTFLMFGAAGADYIERHGAAPETFAKISVKARKHAAMNPNAVFRDPVTVEEVMASRNLYKHVTKLQACPPTNGAAATIVCSEEFAKRHGIDSRVRILGQGFATDTPESFDSSNLKGVIGAGISEQAARQAYEQAGIGPDDIDVIELHDCFTVNEVFLYEALGLTPEGTAEKFINDGDNTYGGRYVVNPSGGLLSKGHPLGATGVAQIAELTWQLRGTADGGRQVDGARVALQHNAGLGGAAIVTLLG